MSAPVTDANATRGAHLRTLLRHPLAIGGTVLLVALAGGITGAAAGLGPGLGAAAGAFLLAALVLLVIADARAAEDFFNAYATSRSLATGGGRGYLPGATSLLRKGLRRYTDRAFAGKLAGRVDGVLAFYTYETETTDSKGNRHTQYHNFTVALTAVPESVPLLGELALQRRAGFRFFDKAEDAFRTRQRVELESEELDRRYEIFIGQSDDQNKARQLFSPTFIDWLATGDEDMGFELEGGMLAVNVPGHPEDGAALDAISAAAAEVTERISAEAMESAGPGAERPASDFNPGSFVSTVEAGGSSASLKRRLWGLFLILCVGVGVAIGFATSESDSGPDSGELTNSFNDAEIEAADATLLPVMVKKANRKGVVKYFALYGNGIPNGVVNRWVIDAVTRGLVGFEGGNLRLTPQGVLEARQAD